MKKIFFLPLFFICLLTFQSLAQESKEESPPPSDPELLRLTIKPNYDCISGAGCSGSVEETAKTFAIVKAKKEASSGGLQDSSVYLEKHEWSNGFWDGGKYTLSNHPTDIVKTESKTEHIITYPSSSGQLTIKYTLGAFNPETRTQDFSIENIEGLKSYKQEGKVTPDPISFNWKIVQKEDGSFKVVDAEDPSFEIHSIILKIGAWKTGILSGDGGATHLEISGTKETINEEGQTIRASHVKSQPITHHLKKVETAPKEEGLCGLNPLQDIKNLSKFSTSVLDLTTKFL